MVIGGRKRIFAAVAALLVLALAGAARADNFEDCGSLKNHYGPFDYTDPEIRAAKLPIVERFHFSPKVENGESSTIMGDLDYTLRAFPNHHRALYAVARYQLKHPHKPGSKYYSADCYFKRAIRFKPDDGIVYLLYGIYLHRLDKLQDALTQYQEAEKFIKEGPELTELHYNLGLLYADMGDYKDAKVYAEKAYAAGYPLPGLRDKLKRAGMWKK